MSETISPNTTIAQYTIVSKIGEGGMGVVYRARDTKLGRDVAIKLLPTSLSENADRLNRFEQEAQAAGALNHPNILSIYHIGIHEGAPYIVSELLEGETLRERLAGGALPQRKAVDYASQIVKGLAAAHDKGIVHRDIKPDNIFVTDDGRVKILDFGLAKLLPRSGDAASARQGDEDPTIAQSPRPSLSPNRPVNTDPGTVMGTMGYMSPEQLKGKQVDHRSDIFSFGTILYEMLTGKRAFRGDSIAETMSAILREDPPDLSETNKTVSPALERVVRHCLEKNPSERFYSARDLAFAIESLSGSTTISGQTATMPVLATAETETATSLSRWFTNAGIAWIVAAILLVGLLLTLGLLYFSRSPSNTHATRLSFTTPPELALNDAQPDSVVISPDGSKIAFSATGTDGKNMLYVRNLDETEVRGLPGSDNPLEPFWSPDSRSIAYGSNGKLKRSELTGGSGQVLCDAARLVAGTWSKDGVILFTPDYGKSLMQVSAQGGEPQPVQTTKIEGLSEPRHLHFLPDGSHFLFGCGRNGICAGSLASPEIKQIVVNPSPFVYSAQGYLILVRNDSLVAQAFDVARLALSGEPIPIIAGVKNPPGTRRFSVSENGVLVWQGQWERDYQLVWYDREGKQVGVVDAPLKVNVGQSPVLSPDGKRLVERRAMSTLGADSNIWVIDLEKGTGLRITSTFSQMPVWSPDSKSILYNHGNGIAVKAANGTGEPQPLVERTIFPAAWSPDGRFILFMERGIKTRMDLWVLPMFGDRKEYQLSSSAFDEQNPQLSPDGRWLAYSADDTGTYQIYVQSFSADGKLGSDKKLISTTGGKLPLWRRDGKELFFVATDGQLMASSVKTGGPEFQFEMPKPLFKTRTLSREGAIYHEYDVSPDGQRFLIGTLIGDTNPPPPTVILNWTALLKK